MRKIMRMGIGGGADAALRALHRRCVGCENSRPPRAVRDGQSSGKSDGGIDAGETGRSKPPRRLSGTAVSTLLRAVVRGTVPASSAVVPALVRARLHGAVRSEVRARSAGARARAETPVRRVVHGVVRSPVHGAAGTGEARSAPARAEAMREVGAAGEGERGEERDERGA